MVVGELAIPLPGYLTNARGTVVAEARKLPVLAECDVVVAGAGTAGAPAGIAAARQGARTIVCEYLYQMGGVQTEGQVRYYYHGNRVGFTPEIDAGVLNTGLLTVQAKSEWYRRECRKAGAEIWYGVLVCGVVIENQRLTGIVVVTPGGLRGVIRCKLAIDATGNADLAAMAGEQTEFLNADEIALQGAGSPPRVLGTKTRPQGYDIGLVNDTDAADLCFFALRSRLSMDTNVWDQTQTVNSRERRRLVGAFYITPVDILNRRTYSDVVVQPLSDFDSHGYTSHEVLFVADLGASRSWRICRTAACCPSNSTGFW